MSDGAARKIAAKGIYHDPVRSSKSHKVKASGLRWVCLMLLVPIPWAQRVWALPFLTVLAPSERYHQERGQRHTTVLDWARRLFVLLRRWLPDRRLVVVADSEFAALDLLAVAAQPTVNIALITRLRLDAALYDPAPPRDPHQVGRPRLKGKRRPTLQQVAADPATAWTSAARQRLVRGRGAHRGDCLPDRGVVSRRQASRGHPLGAHPRSRGCL